MISDYGIILEIFGFLLLLLVSGRNPNASYRVSSEHKESFFNRIREKIIPNKTVNMFLIIGITAIILGLSFQLTYFTNEYENENLIFDISKINLMPIDSILTTNIIAFSAIIGLIITIVLHLDSARKDRQIRFNELLEKFSNELSGIRLRELEINSIATAIRYQRDWIHVVNRLAYLRKLNKIDDDMINFFEGSFVQAHTLLDWENTVIPNEGVRDDLRYQYAKWWIDKNVIPVNHTTALPPKLVEIIDKVNDGYILVHNLGVYDLVKS